MFTKTQGERTYGTARKPRILRVVRRDDPVSIPKGHGQRPTWW